MYQTAQDHLDAAKNIEASMYKIEDSEAIADAVSAYEAHINKAIHHLADLITNNGHKFCGSKIIDGHYFLTVSSQDSSSAWNNEEIAANLKAVNLWLGY